MSHHFPKIDFHNYELLGLGATNERPKMDHFLSGLEGHNAPWYAARSSVHAQAHEFAVGTNSFQLIPISGSGLIASNTMNPTIKSTATSLDLSTVSGSESSSGLALLKATSAASTVASVAAAVAASVPRLESQIKEEVEILEERNITGLEGFPMGPSRSSAKKHKNGSKWDTKKVCNICGKVLSRGDKLKNHIRIHTNNFPFHCDTCGQGFLRSEGLRIHTRIHTGERPYVCVVCGKAYTRKDKLTRHAIVHTGERPFVCQHCGKSFTRKDKMQRHELIHKVEKPWTCVPCNLEFVRQEGFNAHMEKKHPERLPYTLIQHPRHHGTTHSSSPHEYHMPEGLASHNLSQIPSTAASHNSKTSSASTSNDFITIASNSKSLALLTSRLPAALLPQP